MTDESAKPHDVGHHRGDVGDRGEDAAEAEHGHRHREEHLDVAEGGQLASDPYAAFGPGQFGYQPGDAEQAEDAQPGDDQEGDAPAEGLPDEGAERDADHVRHGQAGEHHGDGSGLLLGGDEPGGDDGADAEEGAVGEGGDDAAYQHDLEGGASAESTLPAMNRPMRSISIRLRGMRVPRTVISGAPRTTPRA